MLDLGPHHIDLFRYLFDTEVETTRARIWSERTEEDCATVQMTLADGTDVQSFFSLCATDQDLIKVQGEAGTMVIDRYGSDRIQFESLGKRRSGLRRLAGSVADFLPTPCLWRKLRAPWHEPSYAIALQQFIRAIGREPGVSYPDFDDGWRCQEIIEAAEESSRTAQPVEGRSATIP